MKHILIIALISINLFAASIKRPILTINSDATEATIAIDKIDVGMSGFVVKEIAKDHSVILNNATVKEFDASKKIATITLGEFTPLKNDALPQGKWRAEANDTVSLAANYSRGVLIAPTEEIYHKITTHTKLQWIHPDLFATVLSFNGHPTPMREDFRKFSEVLSAGLALIYLDGKVFTIDIKSFKILSISDAKLEQKTPVLPFYTRVQNINANWFGEGSSRLDEYEPHYYELLAKANNTNKKLYEILKNGGKKYADTLKEFDQKGMK